MQKCIKSLQSNFEEFMNVIHSQDTWQSQQHRLRFDSNELIPEGIKGRSGDAVKWYIIHLFVSQFMTQIDVRRHVSVSSQNKESHIRGWISSKSIGLIYCLLPFADRQSPHTCVCSIDSSVEWYEPILDPLSKV